MYSMYDKQVSYRIQSTTTGHGCNIMQQQQSKTLVGTMEAVQRLILLILFLKVSAFRVESKENAAATSSSVDVDGNISQTKEEKSDRHVLIQGRYECECKSSAKKYFKHKPSAHILIMCTCTNYT